LPVANPEAVTDTGRFHRSVRRARHALAIPSMYRTPSKPRAALWMAGWLALMLILVVAGREATRELNVFQIMELRSIIAFFMLYPLIRRCSISDAIWFTMARSSAGSSRLL
jgi:hypothetical protein